MQPVKTVGAAYRPRWKPASCTPPPFAFAVALWQLGQGTYIQAKAWLAQVLIKQAWARTLEGEAQAKPWPWADTWPVARITVPGRDIERFVLAGANGRSIAFGPGHVFGTPLPGEAGNSVIGAHRDTHFAFLRELRPGEEIVVQKSVSAIRRYRVAGAEIVDKSETRVLAQRLGEARLTLITCYPFDALRAGGRCATSSPRKQYEHPSFPRTRESTHPKTPGSPLPRGRQPIRRLA
jgi:sortase A